MEDEILAERVGKYEMGSGFIFTVTNRDRLFIQAIGQGRSELLGETETTFFMKVNDA